MTAGRFSGSGLDEPQASDIDAGFEVVEERQPSFLFDRSVLVTGEVARTTGYEPGFPPQQAWDSGGWEPDPARPGRPGADRRRQGQGAHPARPR